MSKKYTNIEDQLTEGFWDAIVNKAKRAGLATSAALGSNKSRGKLDANTFATQMYDQFKRWQGQTNASADRESIAEFLFKEIHMAPDFIEQQTGVPVNGSNNQNQQPQVQQSSGQGGSFDDPLKHMDGPAASAPAGGGDNGNKSTYTPGDGDFVFDERHIKRFMESTWFTKFKDTKKATGFDKSPSAPFDKTKLDGAFIFSATRKDASLLADLKKAESDANSAIGDLKQHNYFVTWDEFKAKVPGGSRIAVDSPEEADLFRQSWYQAYKEYDHVNFPENIDRFVLSIPPRKVDPNATTSKPPVGTKFENFEESVATSGDVLLEADMSDKDLRAAFMHIAQTAMRDGQWKVAANRTMHQLRGDNIVGNAVQTNNGNQQNNQQGGQQNNAGSDLLSKAQTLGKVLGANINKFTLNDMRKKDPTTYREFMQFLHDEKGSSFSQEFLDHAKETLKPFFDFTKAQPDPNANQNVNSSGNTQNTTGTAGASNETTGGAEGEAAKGEEGADEDGLKFYDIDRRKIAWDAQNEMLIVRMVKNGKTNESTFKRTDDGWVTDRNTVVQEKFVKLIDNWYDRVMANSGGEAAQDSKPATPEPKDPTVIPTGATVTNPSNNGQYKYNGKTWMTGDGKSIPADSDSAKSLDALYRESKGISEPKQADAQDDQSANAPEQEQPEADDQQAGDVKPDAATPNQEEKPIPNGAKLKNSKVEYTFNNGSWIRPSGDAVPKISADSLSKLYREGKPLPEPEQPQPQANSQPNQQSQQPAQKAELTPDEEDAVASSKPAANVGNETVPTDAKLSHNGNVARKLARGVWWNEKTKQPFPKDQTAKIDDLYRRSLAAKDGSATPPEGSQGAPDGSDFKLGGGVQYKKENGQWMNVATKKPITDQKAAMHLETEFKKQQNKKGSGATLTRTPAANDDGEPAAPTGAKFKQNDRGIEYKRTADGWVDPKGNVIDNEAQVAAMDRGYNNARKKGGLAA